VCQRGCPLGRTTTPPATLEYLFLSSLYNCSSRGFVGSGLVPLVLLAHWSSDGLAHPSRPSTHRDCLQPSPFTADPRRSAFRIRALARATMPYVSLNMVPSKIACTFMPLQAMVYPVAWRVRCSFTPSRRVTSSLNCWLRFPLMIRASPLSSWLFGVLLVGGVWDGLAGIPGAAWPARSHPHPPPRATEYPKSSPSRSIFSWCTLTSRDASSI